MSIRKVKDAGGYINWTWIEGFVSTSYLSGPVPPVLGILRLGAIEILSQMIFCYDGLFRAL